MAQLAVLDQIGFTVLGASGYIGSRLTGYLRSIGQAVYAPRRNAPGIFDQPLGHVIYAIGLTADFRGRPIDTMEAHVSVLAEVLRCGNYDSLTYLSSTRVYAGAAAGREDCPLTVDPADPDGLYNLSKLAGEALCLAQRNPRVQAVRLSNVFGVDMDAGRRPSHNFLATLVREAARTGHIGLRTARESTKDYISIEDLMPVLHRIAIRGSERIYNVASGRNTSNGAIADALARLTGCRVDVAPGAPTVIFPPIAIERVGRLFPADRPWAPVSLLDRLPEIVGTCRQERNLAGGMP